MEPMVVVSGLDSALDIAAMTARGVKQAWLETRKAEYEIEVPGLTLTRFHLGPIPRSVFANYVRRGADQFERNERAFACGVARVDGVVGAAASITPTGKIDSAGFGKVDMWTPKEMELFSEGYVQDIGALAWYRSFLAHLTEPLFPVPLFLAQAIALRLSRSVVATPTTPTTTDTDESSVQ